MRVFLPWDSHLLPSVAARLLADHTAEAPASPDADFSNWLLVVRGRSASRRLLALLAAEAQRAGRALTPPRIVTPGSLDTALFSEKSRVAPALVQRLAWTVALQRASAELLARIWTVPGDQATAAKSLATVLDRTWRDLSASGLDFAGAFHELAKIAPDSTDTNEERWNALQTFLGEFRAILGEWGFVDTAAHRARLAATGRPHPDLRLALIGIIELPPELEPLLRALRTPPHVFIHAPESESAGFDDWGRLVPTHWASRPCRFTDGEIHVVRGANDQAARCAQLISAWKRTGLPADAVTVAAPEPASVPSLLHGLADADIDARSAEGTPASRTAPVQLLSQIADFLDRPAGLPPTYASVAALVRHPDLADIPRASVSRLDDFFNAHLPMRVEVRDAAPGSNEERIARLLEQLERLASIRSVNFTADVTRLLLEVYGGQHPHHQSDSGRALHAALHAVRSALDEIEHLPSGALAEFPSAELLRIVVEFAGNAEVPEHERPGAVEVAGWLEAASDDAPALIVTSVIEGALPEGAPPEPLLLDALRERIGLPCRASRFARDQYTLHTVTASRRGNGRIALIAPRHTTDGLPARPSRLLLGSAGGDELARRLLALTTEPRAAATPLHAAPGLMPPEPDVEKMRAFRVFSATSFRSYLRSPRMFYFQNILRLDACDDSAEELDGRLFGTAIHSVLQTFGERHLGSAGTSNPAKIESELHEILDAHMRREFGPFALPPVRAQARALIERLTVFATHQAALFADGWRIAYVESKSLTVPLPVPGGPTGVILKGRIDRIDHHAGEGRWRVIDYKTSAQAVTPDKAHFSARSGEWRDLQLPLYMRLLPELGPLAGVPVHPERTELVYFNLPPKPDDAGITEPFDRERISAAWEEAQRIAAEICSGEGCREIGKVSDMEDPAFLALCGLNGLPTTTEED